MKRISYSMDVSFGPDGSFWASIIERTSDTTNLRQRTVPELIWRKMALPAERDNLVHESHDKLLELAWAEHRRRQLEG